MTEDRQAGRSARTSAKNIGGREFKRIGIPVQQTVERPYDRAGLRGGRRLGPNIVEAVQFKTFADGKAGQRLGQSLSAFRTGDLLREDR